MDRLDAGLIDVPGVQVCVVERCTSTNSALLREPCASTKLLAAEVQTAGRGRRGRRWHSEPGADLTFSIVVILHASWARSPWWPEWQRLERCAAPASPA
jgi:biotin-(acetyl-CoA carboxylase) ligase